MRARLARSQAAPAQRFVPSRRTELHLLERGAAEQAVWIGEGLRHLEVVVALAHQERGGLADRLHGGGKVAALALEFRRLERAMRDDHRAVEQMELALEFRRLERAMRDDH